MLEENNPRCAFFEHGEFLALHDVLPVYLKGFVTFAYHTGLAKKMNINTLGDLLRVSEPELLGYKNFGETSLNEIKAMLKQRALQLGQLAETEQTVSQPSLAARRIAPDAPHELLNKPLSEIELSGRSRKCLQRLNLVSIGDLIQRTEAELLATKNFGQTSLNEIKTRLEELGVSLRTP